MINGFPPLQRAKPFFDSVGVRSGLGIWYSETDCSSFFVLLQGPFARVQKQGLDVPVIADDRQRHAGDFLEPRLADQCAAEPLVDAARGEVAFEAPDHRMFEAAVAERLEGAVDQGV